MVEAMAWESGAATSWLTEEIAETMADAQEQDGYLNTRFGHRGREHRYSDLEWGHELYCYGHIIQAAVARLRTRGEDRFTEITRRAADHVCEAFRRRRPGVCGHPEIEMALVELYRATGEERYLEQARLSSNGAAARCWPTSSSAARTSRTTCRSARPRHSPATPCARCTWPAARSMSRSRRATRELLETIERQWERTIASRTYLTGGMGSRHADEAFGEDYELPPDRAYSETCAGVASVQLAWRLLLATGDARYADLAERTLYNVVATSPALDGSGFFYANPLHQRVPGEAPDPDAESPRAASSLRAPWFDVSCCPTNVARTLASLAGYVATTDDGGVQLHQLAPCTVRAGDVRLRVITGYPWGGEVVVRVEETGESPWRLQPARAGLGARGGARRPRAPAPGARPATPSVDATLEARRRGAARAADAPALDAARTRASTPSAAASRSSAGRSSTASSRRTRRTTSRSPR